MGSILFISLGVSLIIYLAINQYHDFAPNKGTARDTLVRIQEGYSPGMTKWQAARRNRAAVGRVDLLGSLFNESYLVTKIADLQYDEFVKEISRATELALKQIAFEILEIEAACKLQYAQLMAQVSQRINVADVNARLIEAQTREIEARNKMALLKEAYAERLDLTTYLDTRRELAYHKLELQKTKDFNIAEYEKECMDAEADIGFAISSKYLDLHNQIIHIQKRLDGLYEEVYSIQTTEKREKVREAKVKQREGTIDALEKGKLILEERLCQSNNGKNERGTDKKVQAKRDARRPLEEGE